MTLLDEESTGRWDLYLTMHNTHKRQDRRVPGWIRTRNHSRQAAADLRLRPEVAKHSVAMCQSIAAPFFYLCHSLFAPLVWTIGITLAEFFGSAYLCEEDFCQMKIIKSRYRNRLTNKHLQYWLRLYLSNYKPSFSKLSHDLQCNASASQ